jgi:ubiquitin carboxyl-terminal hydrolase 5/13
VVSQLAAMGFPERKCKKAALATGNANVEAAMEWLLLHADEFETEKSVAIDSDTIRNLESMGFPSQAAEAALIACDGDINRAVEWLFSRADEMPAAGDVSATANLDDADTTASSGNGHYELVGFISHIGSNTACGHYVCHIKKVRIPAV